jgi:thioredoxin 1
MKKMNKAIRFTAKWCGPCKTYAPIWDNATNGVDNWIFEVVDVDEDPEKAKKYNVRSIPTTILEDSNGELLEREQGVISSGILLAKLEEFSK